MSPHRCPEWAGHPERSLGGVLVLAALALAVLVTASLLAVYGGLS